MVKLRKEGLVGLLFGVLLLLPACCYKSNSNFRVYNKNIFLFIQMPQNPFVFDDISSLMYSSLYQHFYNVGYNLVDTQQYGYTLRVKIKGLDPEKKFVSPDVILIHYYANLEIECTLLNFNNEIVKNHNFFFSVLFSKPRDPVLVNDFVVYTYKKLFAQAVPKIEYFFRQYLIKAFS